MSKGIGDLVRDNRGRDWRIVGFAANPVVGEALARGAAQAPAGAIIGVAVIAVVFKFRGGPVTEGSDERGKAPRQGDRITDALGRRWEVVDFLSNDHISAELAAEVPNLASKVEIPVVIANFRLLGTEAPADGFPKAPTANVGGKVQ